MKIEGIVISQVDYKEQSKIVNIYTPLGKIGVKALGSKKLKNGLLGFTTTGNVIDCVLTDNDFKSVKEYQVLDSMYNSLDDINVIDAFGKIIDTVNSIPEDANHKVIYPYVKKSLENIRIYNPKKVLCIFLIKMLYAFSVSPNLKESVDSKEEPKYFDPILGGGSNNSGSNSLSIWKEYYYDKKDIDLYSECDYKSLYKEIKLYYEYHVPKRIKL